MAGNPSSTSNVEKFDFSSGIPKRPLPDPEALKSFYVGRDISEVPKPAAILDVAKIRRHCSSMLETVEELGVEFRPHVKTHKVRTEPLHSSIV